MNAPSLPRPFPTAPTSRAVQADDSPGLPHRELLPRRRFLQSLGLAAGTGVWCPIPTGAATKSAARPRLRFVQINDLHVQAPGAAVRTYAQANEKARWLVAEINREPRPDFVLGIGDLIHGERLEQLPRDFAVFQEIIKPLAVPFYPGLGNHEVIQREGDPRYEKAYREMFGHQRVNYTFSAGGLRFIMLNNSGATVVGPEIVRQRNAWLRDVLQAHRGQPKIVGCHIPLVPVRNEPVLTRSFGFRSYTAHDEELLGLVDEHADSIIAVLSGHLHLTGALERGGVHHISIAGTASYPSDFARFELFDDRLTMQVCQLPAELAKAAPSIHGRPRHKVDFTDSTHDTGETYQSGRGEERNLTVTLKRPLP